MKSQEKQQTSGQVKGHVESHRFKDNMNELVSGMTQSIEMGMALRKLRSERINYERIV